MFYQIIVSKNGRHFFSTTEHSAVSADKAHELFHEIKLRFTEEQGYMVSMYLWTTQGKEITP